MKVLSKLLNNPSGGPPTFVEVIMGDEMCIKYVRAFIACLEFLNPSAWGVIIQGGGVLSKGGG